MNLHCEAAAHFAFMGLVGGLSMFYCWYRFGTSVSVTQGFRFVPIWVCMSFGTWYYENLPSFVAVMIVFGTSVNGNENRVDDVEVEESL